MHVQVRGPKMLMLAGTDRLDKHLTIGQMQVRRARALVHCGCAAQYTGLHANVMVCITGTRQCEPQVHDSVQVCIFECHAGSGANLDNNFHCHCGGLHSLIPNDEG